ncbi:hypothetical protein ILUMI_14252 [Ignelater luminosus]|uniref:Uncharacterized protein n=1 Tax=Ignelater luminosus TaxID=2038154 RepID=A0A8K0CWY1_IGNLU|nr:hypothetical protein ILUMI_14252 [Ignelater luminosus]
MELLVVQTWVKPKKSPSKRKFNKIEKKRRDAMRRLRDAIRNDPVRYEAMKDKERQRYHERINTLPDSPHSLDENMDYWLKNNNSLETPSTSREDTPNSSRQSSEGKKQRQRNTYKYKLKIKQLEKKLRNEKNRVEKYKKRLERAKNSLATPKNKPVQVSRKKADLIQRFKLYVKEFHERDENSRPCPRKKDTVT